MFAMHYLRLSAYSYLLIIIALVEIQRAIFALWKFLHMLYLYKYFFHVGGLLYVYDHKQKIFPCKRVS
jgi:hypothetical protein